MENTSELLTPAETARELRVSIWTLQDWRSAGGKYLPFVRIGARIRYRKADVERLIDGGKSLLTELPRAA